MQNPILITLLVFLFPLGFAALWCLIVFVLARASGWHRLSLSYATDQIPHGNAFGWQSGYIGLVGYRNCINVSVAREGLFLSLPWLFRLGHKTLLIPWSAIHDVESRQVLWNQFTRFQIGTPSLANMQLPTKVLEARRSGN